MRFVDRNHELELELEDSHGLASVRHHCADEAKILWTGRHYELVQKSWLEGPHEESSNSLRIVRATLDTALLSDGMLQALFRHRPSLATQTSASIVQACLSARWGEEVSTHFSSFTSFFIILLQRSQLSWRESGAISVTDCATVNEIAQRNAAQSTTFFLQTLSLIANTLASLPDPLREELRDVIAWMLEENSEVVRGGKAVTSIALSLEDLSLDDVEDARFQRALLRRKEGEELIFLLRLHRVGLEEAVRRGFKKEDRAGSIWRLFRQSLSYYYAKFMRRKTGASITALSH